MRSSLDVAALYSALHVDTSVPQVAIQPPIVINVTTNVTTIPVNPAREHFIDGMVRTYLGAALTDRREDYIHPEDEMSYYVVVNSAVWVHIVD